MAATKLSVLIVTAEADSAWCADAGLAGIGFAVRVTGSAEAALRSAADVPADVILVDFATPGVDGLTLAGSLRGQPRGGKAPLMVVAVRASDTDPAHRVAADGVDLSLCRDAPDVAGVIVGVMKRFDDFFNGLHSPEGKGAIDCDPPTDRPRHRFRHLSG